MKKNGMWITGFAASAMIALGSLMAGSTSLAASAEADGARSAEVSIDNFSFGPAQLTVAAGTTVTWTNHDDMVHNVVSEEKLFKSKALDTDETFSYTFVKPGTYAYFCSLHPRMTGRVVVE